MSIIVAVSHIVLHCYINVLCALIKDRVKKKIQILCVDCGRNFISCGVLGRRYFCE